MSESETLLYLHDKLIQQADYAKDTSDMNIFIPYTMSTTGVTVCQSYSAVFNHLIRDLGFTGYVMAGDNHGWNAVKTSAGWTYIDPTWDDPTGEDRDFVYHRFLMVPESSFKDSHTLTSFFASRFAGIEDKLASVSIMPKDMSVLTAMNYLNGTWYFAADGEVYSWDGHSSRPAVISSIAFDRDRCISVINETIYVGGSDGVSTYDPATGTLTTQSSTPVSGLFYFDKALYYKSGSTWTRFIERNAPYADYTALNGSKNSETVSLTTPGQPAIKAKRISSGKIRVSVSKLSANANKGYRIQLSTSKSFSSGTKTITVKGTSITKSGLGSHRTYYVRARGVWKANGHIYTKYGKWSSVKKVRL